MGSTMLCCGWGHHHLVKSISQDKSCLPKVQGQLQTYPKWGCCNGTYKLGMLSGWLCVEPVLAAYAGPAMPNTMEMDRKWNYFRPSCSSLVERTKVCKRSEANLQCTTHFFSVLWFASMSNWLICPPGGYIYLYDMTTIIHCSIVVCSSQL